MTGKARLRRSRAGALFQDKPPHGGYGRIHFDYDSDVELEPPSSVNVSARALGGMRGDIYVRQTTVFIGGPRKVGQGPLAGTTTEDSDDIDTDGLANDDPSLAFQPDNAASSGPRVVLAE